jgi:hypothetical protein
MAAIKPDLFEFMAHFEVLGRYFLKMFHIFDEEKPIRRNNRFFIPNIG